MAGKVVVAVLLGWGALEDHNTAVVDIVVGIVGGIVVVVSVCLVLEWVVVVAGTMDILIVEVGIVAVGEVFLVFGWVVVVVALPDTEQDNFLVRNHIHP